MHLITRKPYRLYFVNIYSHCAFDPSSNGGPARDITHPLGDPPSYTPCYTTNRGYNTPLLKIFNPHDGRQIAP